ncbi:putative mRNA-splicing protein ubp10, partial [Smittium culicis]
MTDSTEKRSRSNCKPYPFTTPYICNITNTSSRFSHFLILSALHLASSSSHSEESDHSQLLKKSKDLYLDSVDRSCLDFDFEKICSVTLSDQNAVIDPRYTEQDVLSLDKTYSISYDLNRSKYRPGFVGLNNIKANDYINVIIQALAHIPIIRNMLLLYPNSTTPAPISSSEPNNNNINTNHKTISHPPSKKIHPQNSELLSRFSLLVRKMWHKNSFKSHVSPHELIQEITNRSNKAFRLDAQGDAFEFLTWFLNSIHFDLIKSANYNSAPKNKKSKLKSKSKHSIIHSAFQGSVKVISQDINFVKVRSYQEDPLEIDEENEITTKISPFLTLGLDLPPPPLFRKEDDTVIPQTSLMTLLKKYNGSHVT